MLSSIEREVRWLFLRKSQQFFRYLFTYQCNFTGLWIRNSVYIEKPLVNFAHQYFLVAETQFPADPIVCSTFPTYKNNPITDDCSLVQVSILRDLIRNTLIIFNDYFVIFFYRKLCYFFYRKFRQFFLNKISQIFLHKILPNFFTQNFAKFFYTKFCQIFLHKILPHFFTQNFVKFIYTKFC